MKKYIINGVTGFIASSLAYRLLNDGNIVIGIGRNYEKLNKSIFGFKNFIPLTANEIKDNMGFLFDADIFLNLAWSGYGNFTNDFQVQFDNLNVVNSSILIASEVKCKKYIFFNSSAAFQVNRENADYCSIYGAAKNAAERLARVMCNNSQINYNSIIFSNIYGVGDCSERSVNSFVNNLLNDRPLYLTDGHYKYDWTYIEDAVDGIIAVCENGKSGMQYYVGNRHLITLKNLIESVKKILLSKSQLNFGKYKDLSYIDYSLINLNALYNDTGFECKCDFKESILKTAEWVKTLNFD